VSTEHEVFTEVKIFYIISVLQNIVVWFSGTDVSEEYTFFYNVDIIYAGDSGSFTSSVQPVPKPRKVVSSRTEYDIKHLVIFLT
jgi:hypothetical protein